MVEYVVVLRTVYMLVDCMCMEAKLPNPVKLFVRFIHKERSIIPSIVSPVLSIVGARIVAKPKAATATIQYNALLLLFFLFDSEGIL